MNVDAGPGGNRFRGAIPWLVAIVAAIGIGVLAVVVVRTDSDDDAGHELTSSTAVSPATPAPDSPTSSATEPSVSPRPTEPTETPATNSPSPTSPSGSTASMGTEVTSTPRLAPVGSGTDPALVAPTVKASFSEDVANGLPPAEGAPPWSIVSGTWATTSGEAVAVTGSSPALATITAESVPLRAQLQLPGPSPGAGLAFDVVGPTDFLAWVALPAYGNMNLVRVADGAVTALASSGLTAVEPGVHLGIRLEADRVELLANGVVVAVYDGARAGTSVGLVALRSSAATFDNFVVQYG